MSATEQQEMPIDRSSIKIGQRKSVVGSLLAIGKSARTIVGLKLMELGLFAGQDELLLSLDEVHVRNVVAVANDLNVRPSTVSKMIDRLAEAGLVERSRYPNDARLTGIRLTTSGVEMRDRVRRVHAEIDAEIVEHLIAAGAVTTATDLHVIDAVVTARMRRLR